MSERRLTVLGTAAQMPTRERNHNGLFLKWDNYGFLIDPGEGTQRQLTLTGIAASKITHILITHFHGDHCLGLAGVVQRVSIDGGSSTIRIFYPQSGEEYLDRLLAASIYQDNVSIGRHPVDKDGEIFADAKIRLSAGSLNHRVQTFGYRVEEQPRRTLVPGKLKPYALNGREINQLVTEGQIEKDGVIVELEHVSVAKPTQSFAVILDTAMCKNAYLLSKETDLLVCESTYLHSELELAKLYGHLTARQAGTLAAKISAKRLVLTHFSQRYPSARMFEEEAKRYFEHVTAANDLDNFDIPIIKRKRN